MNVPLVDLEAQYRAIAQEIDATISSVVQSGRFIGGPQLSAFEAEFASYCGVNRCVALSSGTAALLLALQACGVGKGDEVITSTHTFVATAEAIALLGARPVLVDICPDTYTLSPERVKAAITGRTRAVVPVHIYGHPADMDPLEELCERYGLSLVEDAAQAHGALYRGRKAGSIGRCGCFSFYPGKNLGAYGDAGAVMTEDSALADRVQALADHGRARGSKYEHAEIGFNHRMDALQAAVLRIKLKHLDCWNSRRRALAALYHRALGDRLSVPQSAPWAEPVYHLYVVQVPPESRSALQQRLSQAGVSTGIHYPIPVHLQPAFRYLGYSRGDFPLAEELADRALSLPMYPELTEEQLHHVATTLLEALPGREG